ncbi:MAG: lipoprotein [Gallionellaceae bacterium]|nr:lipoprotein [Gallionellaceae bacterium]
MRFLTILLALFFLAGCGKKGALYLPDAATPAQTTQPAQSTK